MGSSSVFASWLMMHAHTHIGTQCHWMKLFWNRIVPISRQIQYHSLEENSMGIISNANEWRKTRADSLFHLQSLQIENTLSLSHSPPPPSGWKGTKDGHCIRLHKSKAFHGTFGLRHSFYALEHPSVKINNSSSLLARHLGASVSKRMRVKRIQHGTSHRRDKIFYRLQLRLLPSNINASFWVTCCHCKFFLRNEKRERERKREKKFARIELRISENCLSAAHQRNHRLRNWEQEREI